MRIGICGTGGVGKSTLLKTLSPSLKIKGYEIITEITRDIKEKLNLPINHDQSNNYDYTQLLILGTHLSNLGKEKMVTDRCILDGYAYTEYLSLQNKVSNTVRDAVANSLEASLKLYDIIFYIPIEFTLEADGVRSNDDLFRRGVDQIMRNYIADVRMNRGISFIHELNGSVEEREFEANRIIRQYEHEKNN